MLEIETFEKKMGSLQKISGECSCIVYWGIFEEIISGTYHKKFS